MFEHSSQPSRALIWNPRDRGCGGDPGRIGERFFVWKNEGEGGRKVCDESYTIEPNILDQLLNDAERIRACNHKTGQFKITNVEDFSKLDTIGSEFLSSLRQECREFLVGALMAHQSLKQLSKISKTDFHDFSSKFIAQNKGQEVTARWLAGSQLQAHLKSGSDLPFVMRSEKRLIDQVEEARLMANGNKELLVAEIRKLMSGTRKTARTVYMVFARQAGVIDDGARVPPKPTNYAHKKRREVETGLAEMA